MGKPDPVISEKRMIVYGHDYCGQAVSLASVLEEKQIDHEWRDIINGDPSWKAELRELARGNLSVPTVVFADGTVMVEPWPAEVLEHLGHTEPGFKERLTRFFGRQPSE